MKTIDDPITEGVLFDTAHSLVIHWQAHSHWLEFDAKEGDQQPDGSWIYHWDNDKGGPEYGADFARGERFVAGTVKWDGCSHLNFGDSDGYLHLCGGSGYRTLIFVLETIQRLAMEHCPNLDPTLADFPSSGGFLKRQETGT